MKGERGAPPICLIEGKKRGKKKAAGVLRQCPLKGTRWSEGGRMGEKKKRATFLSSTMGEREGKSLAYGKGTTNKQGEGGSDSSRKGGKRQGTRHPLCRRKGGNRLDLPRERKAHPLFKRKGKSRDVGHIVWCRSLKKSKAYGLESEENEIRIVFDVLGEVETHDKPRRISEEKKTPH